MSSLANVTNSDRPCESAVAGKRRPGYTLSVRKAYAVFLVIFGSGFVWLTLAAAEEAPTPRQTTKVRVLLDRSRCPSGGSGVECSPENWEEKRMELDDLVPGPEVPPLTLGDPEGLDELARGTPGPTLNFNGVVNAIFPHPPDTHLAVGPGLAAAGRVVMVTNAQVQIWNKNAANVAGPVLLSTMFPPAVGSMVFDPKILFDQHSGRFFIVVLERNITPAGTLPNPATSFIRMAVSTSGAPNSLTVADWVFTSGTGNINISGTPTWADYPTIGADVNALFVTTNQYPASGSTPGSNIRVFNKGSLMAGIYGAVDLAPVLSNWTIQPAHVYGTTDSGGFYLINRIGVTNPVTGAGIYRLHHITGHPGVPVRTTSSFNWNTGFDMPSFFAPQCSSTQRLATNDTRIINAVYRAGHLYCTLTADPDNDGATEVVWQDLRTAGGTTFAPTITGGGIIDGGPGGWTYQPAINVNAGNDLALVYSRSSATTCASMNFNVRNPGDAPGTFGSVQTPITSAGFYDSPTSTVWGFPNADRWGDYSAVVPDPDSGAATCFWAAHEYGFTSVVGNSAWGTRIVNFCTAPPTIACCFAANICADLTPAACAALPGWTARPAGSKCPTMGVIPGMHSGVATVHWSNPAINCFNIVLRDGKGGVAGVSDCCHQHPSSGCGDPLCQQQVCGQGVCVGGPNNGLPCFFPPDCLDGVCQGGGGGLPHCCQLQWDTACAQQAQDVCGTLCQGAGGCVPGVTIDPWTTSTEPDEQTCNQFGAGPTPPIPPGFFGPGSDPFIGQICYRGEPLGATPFGDFAVADTVVRRPAGDPFDRCALPGFDVDIPIEIVALNLVSVNPITVTSNGGQNPQPWNVRVNLSDLALPQGTMTVRKTHCNGGTWSSVLPVQAKFTFTQVQPPFQVQVLDTAAFGFPPDILMVDATGNAPWVSDADPNFQFDSPTCTNFHPGIEDPNQSTDCDCNNNGIKDSCDIANCPPGDASCADCDHNGRPDECDPDSDGDAIPNDCDNCPTAPNLLQENTDGDAMGDACDPCPLVGFAERDQDGDEIYEPEDNCPCILNRLQEDCNGNGIGDACDPLPCGSPDAPTKGSNDVCIGGANNGLPCAVNSDCPGGFCRLKNRYVTAQIPASATAHGVKVTIISLHADSVLTPGNYTTPGGASERWVGPPTLGISDGAGFPAFNVGEIQCAFASMDWSAVGSLNMYGDVIVPGSTYDVSVCSAAAGPCSTALRIGTAKFGDVIAPVNTVNFSDAFSIVATLQGAPTRPSKTRADLVAAVLTPSNANAVNFSDVGACVSALQSKKFREIVPAAPATCP